MNSYFMIFPKLYLSYSTIVLQLLFRYKTWTKTFKEIFILVTFVWQLVLVFFVLVVLSFSLIVFLFVSDPPCKSVKQKPIVMKLWYQARIHPSFVSIILINNRNISERLLLSTPWMRVYNMCAHFYI